jgi:DNA-binding NarL/FixJ family response regulator
VIRVLVVAASAVARAGLEALVKGSESLELAGSTGASGIASLAEEIRDSRPDVVLMELEPHDEEHLEALAALGGRGADDGAGHALEDSGEPAIVVLVSDVEGRWVAETLRAGARGVLPRHASAGEIVAAVEAAASGLVTLHPNEVDALLPGPPLEQPPGRANSHASSAPGEPLTRRESQILGMLAEGLGNKEIAWRLKISEHTVKFHVASILSKLDASGRTEAVTLGFRQGLIAL